MWKHLAANVAIVRIQQSVEFTPAGIPDSDMATVFLREMPTEECFVLSDCHYCRVEMSWLYCKMSLEWRHQICLLL